MNQPPPLIYLGTCPVCDGGLCRVRVCGVAQNQLHPLAVCDECEAIWTEPDLAQPHTYSRAESPISPVTHDPIWSEANRWATVEDVCWMGWYEFVYIEQAST